MTAESVWESEPPWSSPAEQAVLGACLISARALDDIANTLTVDDFYAPRHQEVYAACLELFEHGHPVDPTTVLHELGGKQGPLLVNLVQAAPVAAQAGYHARIVADLATRRRVAVAASRILAMANAGVDDLGSRAERELDLAVRSGPADEAVIVGDLVDDAIEELDKGRPITGLPTGYTDLDLGLGLGILKPLEPGQLVVVAGRTSVGKSVVGRDLCRYLSVTLGHPTVLASMEMTRAEVMRSLIAAQAKVSLNVMEQADLSEADWAQVTKARDAILAAPMFLDCSSTQTLTSLRGLVRRLKPRVLVVDYFQQVVVPKGDRREGLEELARGFKILAKDEQTTVVLLSQVNRAPTTRTDKRPQIHDLRETGALEQDADTVILLHRDEDEHPGEVELNVAKQRGGATGTARLYAQLHYGRFSDLARGHLR